MPVGRCSAGGAKKRFRELRALAKSLATVPDPGRGTGTGGGDGLCPGSWPPRPTRTQDGTHLQLAQLLDGLLPPLDGRVRLQLQVFQGPFQLLLGCGRQGALLALVLQFRLVLMELRGREMLLLGRLPLRDSSPPQPALTELPGCARPPARRVFSPPGPR